MPAGTGQHGVAIQAGKQLTGLLSQQQMYDDSAEVCSLEQCHLDLPLPTVRKVQLEQSPDMWLTVCVT